MKKFNTLFMMLMLMFGAMLVTSCDEDDRIGMDLEGAWSGKIYTSCEYDGELLEVSYSEIEFVAGTYPKKGTGYWVDHVGRRTYATGFNWKVIERTIYIDYWSGGGIEIYDYRLSSNTFSGYFYDSNNTVCDFTLKHISSPNWGGYDYGWYGNGYYSKGAKPQEDNTKNVRRFYK